MKNNQWFIWGLVGFTAILIITAVVLFFKLQPAAPATKPAPEKTPTPKTVSIQETAPENICDLSFTVTALQCDSITLDPAGTTVTAGITKKLTAHATGGSGTYTHNWTVVSNGANKGTLSSTTANPTNWLAPASLTAAQTWTITDTIKDTSATPQTATCEVVLNFAGLNACFDTCNSDADCEEDLRCLSVSGTKRCVNPSCSDDADCLCASPQPSPSPSPQAQISPTPSPTLLTQASPRVEPPDLPQAGINTPMVLGVSAGILIMLVGLLAL